jgi:hypothetical protein
MFKKILTLLFRVGGDAREGGRRAASPAQTCDCQVDLEARLQQFREEIVRFKEGVAGLELYGRPRPGIRNPEQDGRPDSMNMREPA